ncbi:phage baseplate assembly protein V [Kiloniella litopenaei]|uniref:phage baseplate assembly protein V n=1 Tax=Kiloniella litopenaei TaxID=1549748 RepID=UPI003BADBA8F
MNVIENMIREIAELKRQLSNLIRPAVIIDADYGSAKVRVKSGGLESDWLHWMTPRAGNDRDWEPPEVGEQVLLLCPEGKPERGYVLPSIYSNDYPAPANSADISRKVFSDGFVIEHDRSRKLTTLSDWDGEGTLELRFKNIIIRTGEGGYYHLEHHGKASRISHISGNQYEAETWNDVTVVTGKPDHGWRPPAVPIEESNL